MLGASGVLAFAIPGISDQIKPYTGGMFAGTPIEVITYQVKSANLPVTVVERGNLESSSNKDVYCKVEGVGTTIISIVPEGSRVTKGQLVCELDAAALKDQLTNQVITTKGADAAYQNAKLTREVAEIGVIEYLEGIYKQDYATVEGEIKLAEADLRRAEDRLDWSTKMKEKGYVSEGQYISDKLTLQRAKFTLEQAQTKKNVLEKYTKEKTVKELKSEVEKARSDELAKQATWDLEKSKEEKLNRQIANCRIEAPDDGLVVYANDPGRGGMGQTTPQIEEGATVRERQKIFSLPDTTKMQVNTKVHESMIDRITPGLRARIKVDAFADQTLPGSVMDIAPLPDPNNFFSSDVKVYTTHITIEKGLPGLKPGMTAQVEILVNELTNVLSVPVQAVLEYKNKYHVAVKQPDNSFKFVDVKLGVSNDKLVEVKEGIKANDQVAMNAISLMSEEEKREAFGSATKDEAGKKDWGAAKTKIGEAPVPKVVDGAAGGPDAAKGKGDPAKAKGKGKGARPAFFSKIPPEDLAKMKGASQEEREAIFRKAGATDAEIEQMNQMRQRMQNGGGGGGFGGGGFGGGGGGGPGGGGPGGGGGGGFGGQRP